jgi:hypothetical protein
MAEGSTDLNEAEMSELEKLQLCINQKSDETLESTRRMREMCAEAKVRKGHLVSRRRSFIQSRVIDATVSSSVLARFPSSCPGGLGADFHHHAQAG